MDRRRMLERMATEVFDLVVIGGGITGAGVAREAALRGLSVALVDQADFAYGTSSRSSKLIHGGLRYLRHLQLGLVRESVVERQRLLQMAPHLVQPLPFVLPVYRRHGNSLWQLKLGLLLYDWFAGRTNPLRHRICRGPRLLDHEPLLAADDLLGGALYGDCTTDDGRLVIEVLAAAVAHGAVIANYAAVTGLIYARDGRVGGVEVADRLGNARYSVQARRVLNAAGPWADRLRRLDDPAAPALLRLTKGVHLTVRRARLPLRQAVTLRGADGRVMFAIPSGAYVYLGTTDTDYDGDPAAVQVEPTDAAYILTAARNYFPDAGLGPGDVVSTWAGLRSLIRSETRDPSKVPRDYTLSAGASGLVTVAGGKLTAFRSMAAKIVDRLFPATRRRTALPASLAPLPGCPTTPRPLHTAAALAQAVVEPPAEVERVIQRYGSAFARVHDLFDHHRQQDGGRLAWQKAQLEHAVTAEMAVRLEDVLARRTTLLLFSPDNGLAHVDELARQMGGLLGWTEQQALREADHCRRLAQAMFAWRAGVAEGADNT